MIGLFVTGKGDLKKMSSVTKKVLKIEMVCDNAAMEHADGAAWVLRKLADKIEANASFPIKLMDENGNSIGWASLEPRYVKEKRG
jgi:C4-type Zn-finger protein